MSPGASYTLRDWRGALAVLVPGAAVVAATLALGAAQDRLGRNLLTAAVLAALVAAGTARASVRLKADTSGLVLREPSARMLLPRGGTERRMPWGWVQQVCVTDGAAVAVTLREDAPLPRWMKGRVWTPGRAQDQMMVRAAAPGVDAARLASTVKLVAPQVATSATTERADTP